MSGDWTLDLDGEREHLLPWLESGPDPVTLGRVAAYLARLEHSPVGRGTEDPPGVFSARVPQTGVGLIWLLDPEKRLILLVHVGPA